ncbi:hypothetical protein PENARI_c049G02526 [Penicillium arizonense]|uniref:DUF6987 domain-containing protein n=1 Tax=Penicillium arizonense TaxID=1835702 RepID=A0A1F5L2Q5_PENAI|nr:hypothetical protein PENARI_c049G02526 [Penicillium arizonense]OGE47336.1 hypothetical protein PENARI_c049G02526 [Penicillium arizonense]
MASPATKRVPSAEKHLVPPKKSMGDSISQSPLPGKGASEIKPVNQAKPINRPSTPTALKKNIRKLPKGSGTRELPPASQEKKVSQIKTPNVDKTGTPDEGSAVNLEYEEPLPIRESIEEHEEAVEAPEDAQQVAEIPSKEQREPETKKSDSASGSGGVSFLQRGKNAASRISDLTGTVRDLSNRATAAESQGAYDDIQDNIRGVAKKFKPDEGGVASKLTEKIPSLPTDLSELKGLEVSEEGKIFDNDGNAVGTLVEGDSSDLAGQVVGEGGEILDNDGDLIGRVELVSDETAKQAGAVEEAVDTDNVPSLQDLANLPVAEDGAVKDDDGRVLGRLVEGDPDDLVGRTVDENGEVFDEDGDLIGRVEPICSKQVEESAGEAEPAGGVLLPDVAILRGREINSNGKILNDKGEDLGQVVEGQDPRHLSGKVPNELGQVMDNTGEVIGQVEPVPGQAANTAMQELEDKKATFKKQEANKSPETSQELPDISTLEGLKCNKFGYIVGEDGVPVGELIEGNPKELSKGEFQLDDRGQFWDNRGNILGVAQTIPIEEEDQRPFAGFKDLVVVTDGWVEDATGTRVGQVVDGEIKKLLGRAVDEDGDILDKRGNLIGHAEPWEEPEPEPEEVDFSSLEGLSPNKLGFVIGPDGVLIGRVAEGDLKKVAGRTIDHEGQLWSDDGQVIGRVELVAEEEREVLGPFSGLGDLVVRQDGLVETEEGTVVGRIIDGDPKELRGKAVDDDGDIMDKVGNVIGRAEPYTPSEVSEEPEEDLSELEGMTVNKFGNVVDANGAVFGRLVSGNPKKLNGKKVDGEGQIWGDDGKILGNVELIPAAEREQPEGVFYGLEGLTATMDGYVITPGREVVGRLIDGEPTRLVGRAIDEDGEIVDKVGNVIGRAERWTPEEKERDISPMSGRKVNGDGEVRDEDGNLIGRVTMGNPKALIGKTVNDSGYIVDNDGNQIGECMLEENLPDAEPEPELSPEEAEQQAKEEHDRDLAKKISAVIQQTLESVEPLCKQITQHLERADRTPREELDEEKLVQTVKPLIEDAGNMLQECKSTIRALDPDGSIAASAKAHSASHEATPEEYQLADLLKQLTQTVTTTIDNGRQKIADMPHAKKKLNPLWTLLSEPLFQIIAAVGLLLSGVLGLVNNLLSGLGLGGLVRGLLGGLGIDNLMNSLGLDKLGIGK